MDTDKHEYDNVAARTSALYALPSQLARMRDDFERLQKFNQTLMAEVQRLAGALRAEEQRHEVDVARLTEALRQEVQARQLDTERGALALQKAEAERREQAERVAHATHERIQVVDLELQRLGAEATCLTDFFQSAEAHRKKDVDRLTEAIQRTDKDLRVLTIHVGPVVDRVIADKKAAEDAAVREFEREVAIQAAHADPANWYHTGIWFQSQNFWTCCGTAGQPGDKFSKGCKRRPRDEVVYDGSGHARTPTTHSGTH